MMRALVAWSLHFRTLVVALAVGVVVIGLVRAPSIPVDVFPEFAPPIVEVQTEAPGFSVEEVDELITVPLESFLVGAPGVVEVRSKSVLGLSSIVLVLAEGTDVLATRQAVQERLAGAVRALPATARVPVMLAPLSALSRVMKIGVKSETLSMLEVSELVRWTLRPRLMGVPGVVNVAVWGQRDRELQVRFDPEELAARGVPLSSVIDATRAAVTQGAGGFVDTPNQRLAVVADLGVRGPDSLARISLEGQPGAPRLGDVASVVEGEAPLIGDGVIDGGEGLLLIVEKEPGANTLAVTRAVERVIEDVRPALRGLEIDPTIFRPATFVEMAIANLKHALGLGVVLVALILVLFMPQWRTALISISALPVSLLGTILLLEYLGQGIDTMVLAGLVIALGEVVDDAIIDVENIARRLEQARAVGELGLREAARIVLSASMEVRGAVVYGTLIIVLVMVPVFFLEGLAGSFFRPLAWSYALALGVSLLTALTLTPALSLLLLWRVRPRSGQPPLLRGLLALYRPLSGYLVRHAWVAGVLALSLVGAAAGMASGLGEDFMPRFREYDFLMHWLEKPGAGVEASRRITERVGVELMQVPGVRNFGAHIGRAEVADEVVGPDFTELWISLDPEADYDETIAKVEEVIDGYPGLYRDLLTYLKERIKEVLSGASASLVVRIYGPDLETLRREAAGVVGELEGVPGLIDLHAERQVSVPRIQLSLDEDALELHGVSPRRLRDTLEACLVGVTVGEIIEGQRMMRVVVRGEEAKLHDPTALARLPVELPGGDFAPLGSLAHIEFVPSPNVIKREGGSRKIDVVANVKGRDLGSVAREVEAVLARHTFPPAYHPEVLGEFTAQRAARQRLLSLGLLSVLGILVLLHTNLRSLRPTLLVFLGLPLALAGGVFAVGFSGGLLSLGSFIGFITVLGVGARNSIMMIDHFRHLELEEGLPFGPALVRRGAEERLAPILMTALTTGLALVPILWSIGQPGTELEYPMALVIVGGLASSVALNLLVLPPLYLLFGCRARTAESAG